MSTSVSKRRYILDASIAIKWYLDDEEHVGQARAILAAYVENEITLLAPEHIRYEVPNALLVAANRQRLDLTTAKLAVSNVLATRISTTGDYAMLTSAFDSATRFKCAFYDALYLVMADQFDCPFCPRRPPPAQHARWPLPARGLDRGRRSEIAAYGMSSVLDNSIRTSAKHEAREIGNVAIGDVWPTSQMKRWP